MDVEWVHQEGGLLTGAYILMPSRVVRFPRDTIEEIGTGIRLPNGIYDPSC